MKLEFSFLILGVIIGVIYEMLQQVLKVKHKYITTIITDTLFYFMSGIIFINLCNKLNYGIFRIYLLILLIAGFVIERKTIGKLFAKLFFMIYNLLTRWVKIFKNTALGKFIFK